MTDAAVRTALETWSPAQLPDWNPSWRQDLAASAEPALALVGDASWGAAVRDAVQLPVADPLLWANRRIELSSGHWAITGIRFRGRDVAKPFVDVIATDVAPDTAGIAELAEVLPAYRDFAPLCLRVHLPGDQRSAPTSDGFTAVTDLLVVSAPVARVADGAASTSADVELVRAEPAGAAVRVADAYDGLRRSEPDLDQWATAADEDSLADADEEGLLFDVVVAGRIAGAVAATRDDADGFTGFTVEEIVLDAEHRGHGYGPLVLRQLARALPAGPSDVLRGHIHPDNTRSLRNALASGREVVSSLMWITPTGFPGMPTV
ncbi:GNAT family N-acetyltransferase [Curtobacterium sp. MCPF17_052]|uniref:GNAT family N-acetyltransferase n=1 Tax=Curtobacterium sp. MCPF17_052 TaxID=2175655 RepID=UPI000DA77BCC|nr:GNAT family N-acetyltransferase [Curtobacterium sp. MCPF17_052]WIB11554.1 GNAT family N-acetyltransferase [Curtobacterium sp. MCPF17_052]